MPVVTDIKQQKRSDSRFNIYLDGRYAFALSDLDISTSGLKVGREVSQETVEELRQAAQESKVYGLALRFISFRSRSRQEMAEYLRRKEVEPQEIESVIERLERNRLLDDRLFASAWVANRMSLRVRSKRRLEQELLAKGITREDIAAALGDVDEDAELKGLIDMVERKRRQTQYQNVDKLMAYLARQGYSYELIKKALNATEDEQGG